MEPNGNISPLKIKREYFELGNNNVKMSEPQSVTLLKPKQPLYANYQNGLGSLKMN